MNRLLSPKMVWSSMTAVSIALLSGCSNLQSATAPANASEFTNVGAAAPLALPDACSLAHLRDGSSLWPGNVLL